MLPPHKAMATSNPAAERKAVIKEIKRLSEKYDIGMTDWFDNLYELNDVFAEDLVAAAITRETVQ